VLFVFAAKLVVTPSVSNKARAIWLKVRFIFSKFLLFGDV
jgi:hypothetical protein